MKYKVLFITEFMPWPLNTGGRIRTYNLLKQVSKNNHVTFVAKNYNKTDNAFQEIEKLVDVIYSVPSRNKSKISKILGAFFSLFASQPYLNVNNHFCKEMAKTVLKLTKSETFDLIHLDHLDAAIYIPYCRKNTLMYLDQHNFETTLLKSSIDHSFSKTRRWYFSNQLKKLKKFEASILQQVHAVGAVSQKDAKEMSAVAPSANIHVISNGVNLRYFSLNRKPRKYKIINVGSLDWWPNTEGLVWFLQEVWPQIMHSYPSAILEIVGRNPPKSLFKYESSRVKIVGSVPDIREYVASSDIFVVPLFSGGGSRLKVLEAMAMKIPIVATSKGAEGIDCQHEQQLLIANKPKDFSEQIARLFLDDSLAKTLTENAHELVRNHHSWKIIGQKLEKVYEEIIT